MPTRIQRKRTKGWRMPENTVYVGRPTKWGNPWSVDGYWEAGYSGNEVVAASVCVEQYRSWLTQTRSSWSGVPDSGRKIPSVAELRGKNLACWCPLDQPCHADVLLEIANAKGQE